MGRPIVFLDTETDGVHPTRKVWEVGMIRRDKGGEDRELHLFVHIDLATADPYGLQVGGFYDRHPMGRYLTGTLKSIPFGELQGLYDTACAVARFTHDAQIVGLNPGFDVDTLANLLRSEGLTPGWHYSPWDVKSMAIGWLTGIGFMASAAFDPHAKSDELSLACGIEPPADDERHTAMGDARWVRRWHDRLTDPSGCP